MQIFSFNYNESLFLENQIESFRKFISDEIVFNCVDNSTKPSVKEDIKRICEKNNVRYFDVKNPSNDVGSQSHSRALNFTIQHLLNPNDKCFLVDGDVYAIKPINLDETIGDAHFAGVYQKRHIHEYLHPGFMFINTPKVPNIKELNMTPGPVAGVNCDTGGQLSLFYKKYNYVVKYLSFNNLYNNLINYPETHITKPEIHREDLKSIYNKDYGIEIIENKLIHFRGGSRWNNDILYDKKVEFFNEYLRRSKNEPL